MKCIANGYVGQVQFISIDNCGKCCVTNWLWTIVVIYSTREEAAFLPCKVVLVQETGKVSTMPWRTVSSLPPNNKVDFQNHSLGLHLTFCAFHTNIVTMLFYLYYEKKQKCSPLCDMCDFPNAGFPINCMESGAIWLFVSSCVNFFPKKQIWLRLNGHPTQFPECYAGIVEWWQIILNIYVQLSPWLNLLPKAWNFVLQ